MKLSDNFVAVAAERYFTLLDGFIPPCQRQTEYLTPYHPLPPHLPQHPPPQPNHPITPIPRKNLLLLPRHIHHLRSEFLPPTHPHLIPPPLPPHISLRIAQRYLFFVAFVPRVREASDEVGLLFTPETTIIWHPCDTRTSIKQEFHRLAVRPNIHLHEIVQVIDIRDVQTCHFQLDLIVCGQGQANQKENNHLYYM